MNSEPPSVSFIAIMDFSGRWTFLSESVSDLLGWEANDLRNHSFFELVHPDELQQVQLLHQDTILADKAACIVYMRLKHKDAHKGYLLCAVSRTVVYDRVVGSISFARPGGETLHAGSTAQEVIVVTPAASNLQFRRWHEPTPDAPSPATTRPSSPHHIEPPISQSVRTAVILDRFSTNCTITQYLNHHLIAPTAARRRPFFDFVARDDEALVRSWLGAIKTCGVNERGQPSNAGFGYGRFLLCARGRDSAATTPVPSTGWRLKPIRTSHTTNGDAILVDAIFSAHSDGLVCILRQA
ncbi:hypothetical protein C8F01DRAFT_1207122 [Mycena amicta]|nr:hypothetical protein C8F01DRAFT_1207122 [Mycena amicta]